MTKVYGSMLCPDCVEAKEYFEKVNYKYEFVNITESIANLKEFLKLRDTRKEFEVIRNLGYVGIPAILTDNGEVIVGDAVFEVR
nr:glutaredoxin domain-containing protein [uncultured Fusobacterium sp.]